MFHVCVRCGENGTGHSGLTCQKYLFPNCKQEHIADLNECEMWKREKEIRTQYISEASEKTISTFSTASYAKITEKSFPKNPPTKNVKTVAQQMNFGNQNLIR